MYSTVVKSHSTVVMHPEPQPTGTSVSPQVAAAFAMDSPSLPNQPSTLSPGAYSIPIQIQGGAIKDPTLAGYETPNFIHTREKMLNENGKNSEQSAIDPVNLLRDNVQNDIQSFMNQFDNARDKEEKIKICIYYLLNLSD